MTRFSGIRWFLPGILFCAAVFAGTAAAQQPILFGEAVAGEITAPGETDSWTISTQPGDVLLVRAAGIDGTLWPGVRVEGSLGNIIADFWGPKLAEQLVTVPAGGAGSVAIIVNDAYNGTFTGRYGMWVQRLNQPGNATAVSLGATHSGDIQIPGQMDTRTFTGEPGDVIVARMSNRMEVPSNTVWPLIRLYGPAGNLVKEERGAVSQDFTATLPAAGAYTLLVGDGFNGTFTGLYGIFVQRVNRPEGAVPLDLARVTNSAIDFPGVMKTYTVTLPEGYDSPLTIRMRQTGGKVWPLLRLYGPDGAMVSEAQSFTNTVLSASVPTGRTYTILAGDGFNGTFTGSYSIGWSFAMADVGRALKILAGTGEDTPAARERFNVVGGSVGPIDMADVVWIARNATGLQALP